jgi:hypothetical protein
MITASDTLLTHEESVYARFTAPLASLIAIETGASETDVLPWVIARALIGFHRSLVDYVRRAILAGDSNTKIARDLNLQAKRAVVGLEQGLADYGVDAVRD